MGRKQKVMQITSARLSNTKCGPHTLSTINWLAWCVVLPVFNWLCKTCLIGSRIRQIQWQLVYRDWKQTPFERHLAEYSDPADFVNCLQNEESCIIFLFVLSLHLTYIDLSFLPYCHFQPIHFITTDYFHFAPHPNTSMCIFVCLWHNHLNNIGSHLSPHSSSCKQLLKNPRSKHPASEYSESHGVAHQYAIKLGHVIVMGTLYTIGQQNI